MFYVYIIRNELNELYYGSTNDLKRRIFEHNNGKSFTTRYHQWKLIYYEAYLAEKDARERESSLKNFGQALTHLKKRLKNSLSES